MHITINKAKQPYGIDDPAGAASDDGQTERAESPQIERAERLDSLININNLLVMNIY